MTSLNLKVRHLYKESTKIQKKKRKSKDIKVILHTLTS